MSVQPPSRVLRVLTAFLISQIVLWGIVGIGVATLYLPPVKRALGQKVAEYATQKTGLDITCDSASPRLSAINLEGLRIARDGQTLLSFQSLTLTPNLQALWEGKPVIRNVLGEGLVVNIPPDIRALLKGSAAEGSSAEKSPDTPPADAPLKEGSSPEDPVAFRDKLLQKAAKYLDPAGFNVRLGQGAVFWPGDPPSEPTISLSHLLVTWPKPGSLPLQLGVGSGLPDGTGALDADLSISEDGNQLTLRLNGPGMPLERLRPRLEAITPLEVLEKLQPLLEKVPRLPHLGGDFTTVLGIPSKKVQLEGDVVVSELYIDEPRLATLPFGPIEVAQNVRVEANLDPISIQIDRWNGRVNKAAYSLTLSLAVEPDAIPMAIRVEMAGVPYQDLLESFPPELVPALEGVKLGGTFDGRFQADGNLRHAETMNADYSTDFSRIQLETPSLPLRGEEPLQDFLYRPYNKDGIVREFRIGRGQPGWVTIDQIPPHLISALLLSEDSDFYQHEGFDTEGLIRALKSNLKTGKLLRGGSTITQQLAKNLFLSRERTALRKLQEAVLTYELEQVLTKRQILEYYLNVIEWGPGFYGIGRAAQHYFAKHPANLSVKESAYLCTIIPNPVRYYGFFSRNELTVGWGRNLQGLLDRMRGYERISEEEYQAASQEFLYFQGSLTPVVDLSKLVEDPLEGMEEFPTDEEEIAPDDSPLFTLPQLRFMP